ncbi:hypothetical protein VaNZ11_013368 [Volvox africanus]|uniref:tRNA/rRNA methyltransferase SpoU type domain-containing protein n=1 Tax=Volvox africanus TaxID=51714 RepID=A0ABQ5SGP3_9CHLO|nr:hypothetical protein VaNZ11_013368 [Volvox africanus]
MSYSRWDIKYKVSQRTAAGADKWLDVKLWDSTTECLAAVRAGGYQVITTHLSKSSVTIQEVDWTRPTAFILGNEKFGVSEEAVAAADACAIIPMTGMVESFNISVASALIMYEARQQRLRKLGSHADLTEEEKMALKAVMLSKTVVGAICGGGWSAGPLLNHGKVLQVHHLSLYIITAFCVRYRAVGVYRVRVDHIFPSQLGVQSVRCCVHSGVSLHVPPISVARFIARYGISALNPYMQKESKTVISELLSRPPPQWQAAAVKATAKQAALYQAGVAARTANDAGT